MHGALPTVATRPFPGRVDHLSPVPYRFRDFTYFSQRQYDCLDYDPFHPMLWFLQRGMDTERALWMSTLYMAWYNMGSFWVAFNNCDVLKMPPAWTAKLPVGTQRRNLRGGKVLDHLGDFIRQAKKAGSIQNLLTYGMDGTIFKKSGPQNWTYLKANVGGIWGNGRWSTYTTSELYQKVNRLPVIPNDIMNEGSTGPRTGLCYVYGCTPPTGNKVVPLLDELANQFHRLALPKINTCIPYLSPGHYDLGMVESQLCDFNSLRKGRYYIGRDIDRDQDRLRSCSLALKALGKKDGVLDTVWDTRAAIFHKDYLGERSGWSGRTEYAKRWYIKTGKVMSHKEIRAELDRGNLF